MPGPTVWASRLQRSDARASTLQQLECQSQYLGNRFFPTKLRKSLEKSEKMLGDGRYDPFLGGSKLLLIFQGELLKMVKKYDCMAFIAFFSP